MKSGRFGASVKSFDCFAQQPRGPQNGFRAIQGKKSGSGSILKLDVLQNVLTVCGSGRRRYPVSASFPAGTAHVRPGGRERSARHVFPLVRAVVLNFFQLLNKENTNTQTGSHFQHSGFLDQTRRRILRKATR